MHDYANVPNQESIVYFLIVISLIAAALGWYVCVQSLKHTVPRRFHSAVESLVALKSNASGNSVPDIERRVAAILELKHISANHLDFHIRIMELLCVYIRQNAKAENAAPGPDLILDPSASLIADAPSEDGSSTPLHQLWELAHKRNTETSKRWKATLPRLRTDIELALAVVGQRSEEQLLTEANHQTETVQNQWLYSEGPSDRSPKGTWEWNRSLARYQGYRLDLSYSNLQGADLSKLNFAGANLTGANLQGANLSYLKLTGANLRHALLQAASCHLAFSDFQGAHFSCANLQGANLRHAQLDGASFTQAQLQGAHLQYTSAIASTFFKANMQGIYLAKARLKGAILTHAQLQGALIAKATLSEATLAFANLQNAYIGFGRLNGANLERTFLQGTIFEKASLQNVNMAGIEISTETDFSSADLRGSCVRLVSGPADKFRAFSPVIFADATLQLQAQDHWAKEELKYQPMISKGFNKAWRAWQDTLPKDEDGNFL